MSSSQNKEEEKKLKEKLKMKEKLLSNLDEEYLEAQVSI